MRFTSWTLPHIYISHVVEAAENQCDTVLRSSTEKTFKLLSVIKCLIISVTDGSDVEN